MIIIDRFTCEDIERIFKETPTDKPLSYSFGEVGVIRMNVHILRCDRCRKLVKEYLRTYPYGLEE